MKHTTALLPLTLFVACSIAGCATRDLDWSVTFADPILEATTGRIEVEVWRGGCPGDTLVYFDTLHPRAESSRNAPPTLEEGKHCFIARAADLACAWHGSGAREVDLPLDDGAHVEIVVRADRVGASACPSGLSCVAGSCAPLPGETTPTPTTGAEPDPEPTLVPGGVLVADQCGRVPACPHTIDGTYTYLGACIERDALTPSACGFWDVTVDTDETLVSGRLEVAGGLVHDTGRVYVEADLAGTCSAECSTLAAMFPPYVTATCEGIAGLCDCHAVVDVTAPSNGASPDEGTLTRGSETVGAYCIDGDALVLQSHGVDGIVFGLARL